MCIIDYDFCIFGHLLWIINLHEKYDNNLCFGRLKFTWCQNKARDQINSSGEPNITRKHGKSRPISKYQIRTLLEWNMVLVMSRATDGTWSHWLEL